MVLGPREATGGDFEAFFRSHQIRLLRALYVVTGDRHLAEEATQEAFVRVWERWDRVSGLQDPAGYLFKTAFNRIRSYHRRLTRLMAAQARLRPVEPSIYEIEDRDAATRALAKLTQRQRAALVLTEMLGFDSEHAGSLLGVKAVTARRLASKGREALRKELEAFDD